MALQRVVIGVIILISGQILVSTAQTNVCETFGSGVIQTFSKSMFYLKSTCPFTLTRFTLSGVTCSITVQRNATGLMNSVEITVNKITTVLQDGKITVEGSSISLPFDHTYQLVYQYGVFIKLRSKVLPFSVIWRSQPGGISSVWVQLDHDLLSDMAGVCGRLNGAETPAQLISANVMSDGKCVTEDSKPQKTQVCEVLSFATGCPGGKSAQNLYIDLCSRMPSTVNVYAKCAFFEEVAFSCGNQSNFWSVWRSKTSCSKPTCPGDLKFQELGSPFPPTCTNPQPQSESLVSTCLPPAGMVLNDQADGYHCIDVKSCPCVHGGKTYPPGAERNSKCQSCVCVQGKWSCSANVCPPTCNMEGQAVMTFDGKQYQVPGKCTYVAASGSSWTVTVKYSDTDASIAQMYLDVYQERYTFSANSVKLGQEEVTDLAQTDHTTVFWQSSMFVHVQTSFGMKIKVQVFPEIQLYIFLPTYVKTRGLCGIYNSNTEDDFTTSSGIIENAVVPFTQSWAIGDCNPPTTVLCVNTDNEIFAEQKCSQLWNTSSVFARCHDYVPVNSFFDACVQRTCQCTSGVQGCLCVALSNYAKACASQGIDVGDWRAEADCGVTCNGNLMFSYTMSACNRTCRSLSGSDPTCDVAADSVEGCGCLAGTHLNTPLECSSSALCMCHYQGGTTPPGPVVIDGRQCLCENGVLQCSEACDCPKGKICVHCAQASVNTARRTCESLSKPFSGEETCTSGCYCPAGLVEDHNGGCVTQDNCTCEFSGSVYASGQSVVTNCKQCTCRGGQWYCEGEPCPGVCEVFGNGQYNTFDSKWYRFNGNCQYTLVEDASGPGLFAVRVESVPCCDEALTCSRSISLDLQDVVTLTLRDMNVTETQKSGWHLQAQPLYSVHTVGLYIIISVPDLGLTVVWDKHTRVKIVLQARWKGNVRGLCGNFDGVVTNDLLTRSSSVVFSSLEFGNSWKTAVPPCSDVTQEVFPCERHSYCEAWAQRRCMILLSDTFADCRLKVDPTSYYQACILESCSCEFEGRFLGFCTAVAAYAEACNAQNVCVNWRTPDLCPVYCDYYNEESENGWHYDPCGQTETCGKKHSFTGKLEGCYPRCPLETPYFDENTRKCSSLDKCTCYFNNTVVYPGGKVRTSSECCECVEGQLACEYCASTTARSTTYLTTTEVPKPTSLLTTTVTNTTVSPTTKFSTGKSTTTTVTETTVSPTTEFSTEKSETTRVTEITVLPTTEFSTKESEPSTVTETTVSPTTEFSTEESETTSITETTVLPTTEFSTKESEPSTVTETTVSPTTEFSTGEFETTKVTETTVSPTTEFSTAEFETTRVTETTVSPTTEFSTGEAETTRVTETTVSPTTEFSTGEFETSTVTETTVSPTTETPFTPIIPEPTTATEISSTTKETELTTLLTTTTLEPVYTTKATTMPPIYTGPPLLPHNHTSPQEWLQTTQVSTPFTTATISTTAFTVPPVPCRDPLRNQTWPSGAEWKEDCFYKTCRNSVIEMRPVICPTLVQPNCPRDLMRVVKDEEGCCEKWQCDCQCDLYGDPHYVSFSGTKFDFLENCTYTLVKEKIARHHLSITVDNYFSNPLLFGSSVKGIVLKYHDDTVTLLVNDDYGTVEATLNQNPVQPPYVENGIRFEGTNYQIFVYLDEIRSHVSLDPDNTLQITLAMENFQDNTEGQCGVCGGASCVRRNGQVESEDCCNMTAYEWIEEDPLKPYCASIPKHESCFPIIPGTVEPPPICVAPLCDLLTHEVFRECSENVDVETLVKNCRFDYCVAKSNSSICSPLQHLSEQCKRLGYCVYWRNLTEGACDVTCPDRMVFDECRSTPNDVCKGGVRVPGKFGTDSMRSGCFCPDNQTLAEEYKTTCVSDCTNCKGPLGEPMPAGAIWESHCHICRCNNQTLTEECSPMPTTPTPQCSEDSTLVSDCCDNQICVEKTCEHNGKTYKVGNTWKDQSQPCVTYKCTRAGTEIQTSVCPEQSCSEELRVWDEHHCCFSCNVSCAVRMTTMTVTLEGCTQEVKIPSCEGHCQSNTMWVRSGEVLQLEPERRCCREKKFETRKLSLSCKGAATTHYAYNHVTSCECQPDA
uniref:Uncharacterized protein n=1 Tax=Astyanax mexicanus TaxID=7994 RepID=A0A8B9JZ08_ASTMX